MPCKCWGQGTGEKGAKLLACLGKWATGTEGWTATARRAFIERLSRDAARAGTVPAEGGRDFDTWLADMVVRYPLNAFEASDPFWTCIGVPKDQAQTQLTGGAGWYYEAAFEASGSILGVGAPETGFPTWALVLLGLVVVGGGAYMLLKD